MVTIKIDKNNINELLNHYEQYKLNDITGDYILYIFQKDNLLITVYDNNSKSYYKVTFKGENETEEALKFSEEEDLIFKNQNKAKESDHYIDTNEQIGSDEVGAGDLFFPLIVVSTYVDKNTYELIEKYDIKDSKKMGDKKILEIIPLILNNIKASKLTLHNDKYNELTKDKKYNMVSLKCMMHNEALKNLQVSFHTANIYIDEFVNPKKYYSYLKDESYVVTNINFKNKGETYYPSVALSSCIARYYLLKEKEKLDKKYNMNFPFGAGKKVDEFLKLFIEKYSLEQLNEIIKLNFKNYDRLLEQLKK